MKIFGMRFFGKPESAAEKKNKDIKNKSKGKDIKSRDLKNRMNKRIAAVSYCSLIIFVFLILYLVYFLASDNSEILSNPYNGKRQDLMNERVIRGNIYTSDGTCIAETKIKKNGSEERYYPYDNMFAHAVGYVGNGKTGIESTYNMYMLTSSINPVYAAIEELKGNKNPGDSVITSLEWDIQKTAYDALGNRKGAVIAMEPDTGRIIAMVSRPDFNPNTIRNDWESLTGDNSSDSALLNRATQGLYPPGSTFKLVTLIEYLRENGDYKDFEYECNGKDVLDDAAIKCYNSKKHGLEDIRKAYAKSCNCAFASMGVSLNVDRLSKLCETLLFNKSLSCRFEYKSSSFVLDKNSTSAEVVQTVIGQGKTMISPLHNAMLACMVANGGYMVTPTLVDSIQNNSGREIKKFGGNISEQILSDSEVKFIDKCMKETVTAGTATALSGGGYEAGGKTGSAEYDSTGASHAWFIGYAKKDEKSIAVSIIVEGAGTGSDYAVPIAKKIFDAYY
ncbi:MAG: penicillin-binding protein 2 [Lachnospiraceae bacterium]|nr:penicillin-binding protein 2 [Lachnospiraceae bacterium]